MAGRNLRRQRQAALDALSDQEAIDLARQLVPTIRPNLAATLLLGATRDLHALRAALGEERAALAAQLAHDPRTARLVIHTLRHRDDVEQALGVVRSTSQQRS